MATQRRYVSWSGRRCQGYQGRARRSSPGGGALGPSLESDAAFEELLLGLAASTSPSALSPPPPVIDSMVSDTELEEVAEEAATT